MIVTSVYEAKTGWMRGMDAGDGLALGVDVGVRNAAYVLMAPGQVVGLMWHLDFGAECNDGGDVMLLGERIVQSFRDVRQFVDRQWTNFPIGGPGIVLGIEQQQKQYEGRSDKAWMACVCGMMCQAFSSAFAGGARHRIRFQQPTSITSCEMQRRCGLPEHLVKAVPLRGDKKTKAVEMLEHWLVTQGMEGALERLWELCKWKKNGDPVISQDRRDHVGDAFLHAWLATNEW